MTDVRRGLVSPTNNEFPVENTLLIGTEDGPVTVGGKGALAEDIEAEEVTLRRPAGYAQGRTLRPAHYGP